MNRILMWGAMVFGVGCGLAMLAVLVVLFGPALLGPKVVTWQEEAKQADGSILVLTRTITLGGGHEVGQTAPVAAETISFVHPKTGKTVTWNSPSDPYFLADPFLVQLDGDRLLVLIHPRSVGSRERYGNPCPSFILQEMIGGKVVNKSAFDLPEKFRKVNIVVEPKIEKSLEIIEEEKYLPLKLVEEINAQQTNSRLMALDYCYCGGYLKNRC